MSTSTTQINIHLEADTCMTDAAQAVAESRWADATTAYRLARDAFATRRAATLDSKLKQQYLWGHCQSLIGLAYALHQQDAAAHQAEIEALFLRVKAYQQSRPFIQQCFQREGDPWLGYYQALQDALHLSNTPMVLPVEMLKELDAERAFDALIVALTVACQQSDDGRTPWYLMVEHELTHLCRECCFEGAPWSIDFRHQDTEGRTLLTYAALKKDECQVNHDRLADRVRHQQAEDAEGRVLLDEAAAKLSDHIRMYGMLADKARRQQEEEKRLLDFIARQYDSQRTSIQRSPDHVEDEAWLKAALRQLLEPSAYLAAHEALTKAWYVWHGAVDRKLAAEINALIDMLEPPEALLDEQQSVPFNTQKLIGLMAAMEKLKTTLRGKAVYDDLYRAFERVQACYQTFEAAVSANARAMFYSQAVPDGRPIPVEHLKYFLPDYYDAHNEVGRVGGLGVTSTHPVHYAVGMHFKQDATAVGIEYATHALATLLTGDSTPPTTLVKIIHQGRHYLYLISKTAEGECLRYVCETFPASLNKLEPSNFSAWIVLSLLFNPHDGKGENYRLRPSYYPRRSDLPFANSSGHGVAVDHGAAANQFSASALTDLFALLMHAKVKGIDNDENDAHEVIANADGTHGIGVHNLLYLLPAMDKPISIHTKEQILRKSAAATVVEWLHMLQKQNKHYSELRAQGVLSEEEYQAVYIRLRPGTVQAMYHRLARIQALFEDDRNKNTLKHVDLFRHVQPILYHVYTRIAAGALSPEDERKPLTPTEAYGVLRSGNWTIEGVLADILDTPLIPGEPETIRAHLAKQTAKASDYKNNRTQDPADAVIEFVEGLSLDTLSEIDELDLITQLGDSPTPIESLALRDSRLSMAHIERHLLQPLTHERHGEKRLKRLRLADCQGVLLERDNIIQAGERYGVDVHLTRSVNATTVPVSSPIAIASSGGSPSTMDALSPFNTFHSGTTQDSPWRDYLPRPGESTAYPEYEDRDIVDYLNVAITYPPLAGHRGRSYLVYGTKGRETLREQGSDVRYHTFLLPSVSVALPEPAFSTSMLDASSGAGVPDTPDVLDSVTLAESMRELSLTQEIDKWQKPIPHLVRVAREGVAQDSRDAFIQALAAATTKELPYETLHELVVLHDTWEALKPELMAIIHREMGVDLMDELLPCLTEPSAHAKILFPLNNGHRHWLVGELLLDKTTTEEGVHYQLTAYAHNPYGQGRMPPQVAQAIHTLLLSRLRAQEPRLVDVVLTTPESPYGRRQSDDNACGAIVADDILKRIKGQSLDVAAPYAYGAKTLRNQQSTLVGRALGMPGLHPLPANSTSEISQANDGIKSSSPNGGSALGRANIHKPSHDGRTISTPAAHFDGRLEEGDPDASSYHVSTNAYEIALDAIRASTARQSYRHLIQLLTDVRFALVYDADEIENPELREAKARAHREAIDVFVRTHLITTDERGRGHLSGVPLLARQHFSVDDFTHFYDIAGSLSPSRVAGSMHQNLAIWSVWFSAPYIGNDAEMQGDHVKPADDVRTYFKEHFPELWTMSYPNGYSAQMLGALMHPTMQASPSSPAPALLPDMSNEDLLRVYSYAASYWRRAYHYVHDWHGRHARLEEIKAMHNALYVAAWPFLQLEKLRKGILEERVFLSRQATFLGTFAVILGMLTSPTPEAYLAMLDNIHELSKRSFRGRSKLEQLNEAYRLPKNGEIRQAFESRALQAPLFRSLTDQELRKQAEEQTRRADERTEQAEARAKINRGITRVEDTLSQAKKKSGEHRDEMTSAVSEAEHMHATALRLREDASTLGIDTSALPLEALKQRCFGAEQACQAAIARREAADKQVKGLWAQKEVIRAQLRALQVAEEGKGPDELRESLPAYEALGQALLTAILETIPAYHQRSVARGEVLQRHREASAVYQEAATIYQHLIDEARAEQARRQRELEDNARQERERAEQERERAEQVEARARINQNIAGAEGALSQATERSDEHRNEMASAVSEVERMHATVLRLREEAPTFGIDTSALPLEALMQRCLSAEQACQAAIARCETADKQARDLWAQKKAIWTQLWALQAAEEGKGPDELRESLPAYEALGQALLAAILETTRAHQERSAAHGEALQPHCEATEVYQEAATIYQHLIDEARAAQAQRQRELEDNARQERERARQERERAEEEARLRQQADEQARQARERADKARQEADALRARLAAFEEELRRQRQQGGRNGQEGHGEAPQSAQSPEASSQPGSPQTSDDVDLNQASSLPPSSTPASRPASPGTSEAGLFGASSPPRSRPQETDLTQPVDGVADSNSPQALPAMIGSPS